MGFEGMIEYRHVLTISGGAEFGQGSKANEDLLTVYAEAFDRDADPDDFSLDAIIAHERGHQILARHPKIDRAVRGRMSLAGEEILASILGAMILPAESDHDALIGKATVEFLDRGEAVESAVALIESLYSLLEGLL